MNGTMNFDIVTVIPFTRLSAASRGFLALQGTGPSCIDRLGAQPRMRQAYLSNVVEQQDKSVANWRPAAASAAAGPLAIDLAAASAESDKGAPSIRKGHHATVNRRPNRRPGPG